LIPIPILKVLSSFQKNSVQALLMGGQACVLYGAAEFSRDTDFAILAEPSNLTALRRALDDLCAECIAVPPFDQKFLDKGHAVHFRCRREDVQDMRIDVMAKMRGVDPFPTIWERRSTFEVAGANIDALSLPDLVRAKKTQRDKDWPMIRRLLDQHYFANRANPTPTQIAFWLRELRTPELLIELAASTSETKVKPAVAFRPLLAFAIAADYRAIEQELEAEEKRERAADRDYWKTLRTELEALRHAKRQPPLS
jgi:hypothetical protein